MNMSEKSPAYMRVDRFLIPRDLPAALHFYLDSLAIPHSRREVIYLGLLRRMPQSIQRLMLSLFSKQEPETTTRLIVEVSEPIEHLLKQKGYISKGPLSLIVLEDYENSARDQTVVHVFDRDGTCPVAVGKVTSRPGNRLEHEYQTLLSVQELPTESVRETSPKALGLIHEGKHTILLETFLSGRSIYFEMRNFRQTAESISTHFRMALEWLTSFQNATRTNVTETTERKTTQLRLLEQSLRLCNLDSQGQAKIENAIQLLEACEQSIPEVSRHGDFWAKNCMIQDENIKVVDWEKFQPVGFPLFDAFFFAVSYGLSFSWSRGKWLDPASAFRATFYETNKVSACVQDFLLSYCRAMDLSPEILQVFFPVFLAEKALEEHTFETVPGKSKVIVWSDIFRKYFLQKAGPCFRNVSWK